MAAMRLSKPNPLWLGLQAWRSLPISIPRGRSLPTLSILVLLCWFPPSSSNQHHGFKIYESGKSMSNLTRLVLIDCVQKEEQVDGDPIDDTLFLEEVEQWKPGGFRPRGSWISADNVLGVVADPIGRSGKKKKRGRPRGSKKGQSLMEQSDQVDMSFAVNGDLDSKQKLIPKVQSTPPEAPFGVPRAAPSCPCCKEAAVEKEKRGKPLGHKKKKVPRLASTPSEAPSAVPGAAPSCPSLKGKEFA